MSAEYILFKATSKYGRCVPLAHGVRMGAAAMLHALIAYPNLGLVALKPGFSGLQNGQVTHELGLASISF